MTFSRSKLNRVVSVLRYHRPAQLLHRLKARVERLRLSRTGGGRYARPYAGDVGFQPLNSSVVGSTFGSHAVKTSPQQDVEHLLSSILSGQITLLHETKDLGDPIDWRCQSVDATHLWRFNLHYHEFLLGCCLGANAGREAEVCLRVMRSWISGNPISDAAVHSDAWHPFCISRRLRVWFAILSCIRADESCADILASVVRQTDFLLRHLELDLGGNHLLENLRAIALAAGCLECEETPGWIDLLRRRVPAEIEEQILPSGEHYERSPHYHCEMLEVFLDIAEATAIRAPELSQLAGKTARRMASFIVHLRHPNGRLPLFSDGTELPPRRLEAMIRRAGVEPDSLDSKGEVAEKADSVGDYWVYRSETGRPETDSMSGSDCLIWDAGQFGPDHLPAHGHSDLLGFEASLGGDLFLVDTGTFEYSEGQVRDVVRATSSHNCLEIDGLNQCDVYSRFRVGHRGRVDGFRSGTRGSFSWATASHNAYRDIGIKRLHRLLVCSEAEWLVIDWFQGKKSHDVRSYLHFGPTVHVVQNAEGAIETDVGGRKATVSPLALLDDSIGPTGVALRPSHYYQSMGKSVDNMLAVQSARSNAGHHVCGWHFCLGPRQVANQSSLSLSFDPAGNLLVVYSSDADQFEWLSAK